MRRNLVLVLTLVALPLMLVTAACDDDDPNAPSGPIRISIDFTNPLNGDVIPAGGLHSTVDIVGLVLDCNIGGSHVEGHGHWHLYLDGGYLNASCTEDMDVSLAGVAPGKHALVASLRQNDHNPYDHQSSSSAYQPFIQLDSDDIISVTVE